MQQIDVLLLVTADLRPLIRPGFRAVDLAALDGRHWDVVIDTCGFLPEVVRRSAEALDQARALKTALLVVAGILIFALAAGAIYVFATRVAPGSLPR